MEEDKLKCPMCGKTVIVKKWKSRKGLLKGYDIVNKVMCSRRCRNHFELIIAFNDTMEALDKNFKMN